MTNSSFPEHKPQPFLKWAGGKRALLPEIQSRIPDFRGKYIEPFLGAGAVFLSRPTEQSKLVNDFNSDLIEVYLVIRDQPKELLEELRSHTNSQEHFLEVRSWDRSPEFKNETTPIQRAARFIYLNKTCFNGLYRVNSKGFFNVPFGRYKKPDFINEQNIYAVSRFLNFQLDGGYATEFLSGDYRSATTKAELGDFVYLDPPYDPVSETSSFVAYQQSGFGRQDQVDLRDEIIRLTNGGVPVMLSNSDTEFIENLYTVDEFFEIERVTVNRAISAKATTRGKIQEVLITNFKAVGIRTN
jgi:DNA adenine methylase